MFDIEKEEMNKATPDWQNANWEQITDAHATAEEASGRADARCNPEAATDRIYRKIRARHNERVSIAAIRYTMLATGLTAVGYLVRSIPWMAITLGVAALIFGLIAAYGAGKCSEL